MDYDRMFMDLAPPVEAPPLPKHWAQRDPEMILQRRFANRAVSVSAQGTGVIAVSLHGSSEPLKGALVQFVQTVLLSRDDAAALRDRLNAILEES